METKPSTSRGSASPEKQLRALREFPELRDELEFVQKLVRSLNRHQEESEYHGTMHRKDLEKLEELLSDFRDFKKKICRQLIGDELAKAKAVPILMNYIRILTDEGRNFCMDGYDFQCFRAIRKVLISCTDASPELCIQVGKKGMLKMLLHDLKYFRKSFKSNEMKRDIVMSAMCIFHNCVSVSENIKYAREINAVDTVAWYAQNTGNDLEDGLNIASLMTLSYIVDDDNNDAILANESIIQTCLEVLERALRTRKGHFKIFSVIEVVRGLTRLASNDENSETLVEEGILNSLVKMINVSMEDNIVATEAIWALSFVDANKKKIQTFKNGKIMEYLREFSKSESSELKNAANGALWVLELNKKAKAKEEKSKSSKQKGKGHVMISYQWDSQDTMIKVRNILKSEGFDVWMDIDNMEGSILGSMADAVEKASVVLVCLSQKYKDSHNCRTEGEYVYCIKKPVVPVLVEEKYKPDGWLGALLGMKLYFDLSNEQKFDDNITKLMKELSIKT